jgi:ABC-type amino acid transport substrate-binding protein
MMAYRFVAVLVIALVLLGLTSPQAFSATEPQQTSWVIATRHAPPFVIKTPAGWEGITIELMQRIAEQLGFSYEFREMDLEAMLQATARAEVNAAAAALTVTAEREQQLDFTHPFFTSGLGVAVPQRTEVNWLTVLQGITSSAFLHAAGALLGILSLVGILVWIVERKRNSQFPKDPIRGVGSGIWWSAVTMTTVGYGDKAPLTFAGRLLGLIWMFASIIIISGFTAAIATSLTLGQLDQSIAGVNDLYAKRVYTAQDSTSAAFLEKKLIHYQTAPSISEALAKLAAGQADAVVYDLPILRYLVREEYVQELRVLPNLFVRQDYGIALPPGLAIREQLNQEILRIIQGPEWASLVAGYLGPDA